MKNETLISGFTIVTTGMGPAIYFENSQSVVIHNNTFQNEYISDVQANIAVIGNFSDTEISGNYFEEYGVGVSGHQYTVNASNNIFKCNSGITTSGEMYGNIINNIFLQYLEKYAPSISTRIMEIFLL